MKDTWYLSVLTLHNFLWIFNYFKVENKNLFHVSENLSQVGADLSSCGAGALGAELNSAHSEEPRLAQFLLDQSTLTDLSKDEDE